MSTCKTTLIGMSAWFEDQGSDLFGLLQLPEGLNKDILVNDIIYRAGEFEVLYNNPDYVRFSLGAFSLKWQDTWAHWLAALTEDYDPLENYNRHEEYTDKHTGTQTNALTGSDTTANTGTQQNSETINYTGTDKVEERGTKTTAVTGNSTENLSANDGSTTDNYIWAYNENDDNTYPAPHTSESTHDTKTDVTTVSNSGQTTESPLLDTTETRNLQDSKSGTRTDNLSETKTLNETNLRTDNLQIKHDAHLYGNIGVTTSQQMLKEELEIRKYNIYNMIADMIISEFCILIY